MVEIHGLRAQNLGRVQVGLSQEVVAGGDHRIPGEKEAFDATVCQSKGSLSVSLSTATFTR